MPGEVKNKVLFFTCGAIFTNFFVDASSFKRHCSLIFHIISARFVCVQDNCKPHMRRNIEYKNWPHCDAFDSFDYFSIGDFFLCDGKSIHTECFVDNENLHRIDI